MFRGLFGVLDLPVANDDKQISVVLFLIPDSFF